MGIQQIPLVYVFIVATYCWFLQDPQHQATLNQFFEERFFLLSV